MSVFCELISYAEAVVVHDSELTRAPLHQEVVPLLCVLLTCMQMGMVLGEQQSGSHMT